MTVTWRYSTASARLLTLAVIVAGALSSGCASRFPFGTHHQADDPARGPISGPAPAYASIMRAAETVQQSGDLAAATVLYQSAHQLNPKDAPPLIALGEIAASAGAHGRAAMAFREALRRAPGDVNARRLYGNALLTVDAPAQAAEQFRHVLRDQPDDIRALNALGVSLDLQGEHEQAQRIYWSALEQRPDHLPLRNNLALSMALTGDVEQALAILQELAIPQEQGSGFDIVPMPDTPPHHNALHHRQVHGNLAMVSALGWSGHGTGRHREQKPAAPLAASPERLPAITDSTPLIAGTASLDLASGPDWEAGLDGGTEPDPGADLIAAALPSAQARAALDWSGIQDAIHRAAGAEAPRWFAVTGTPPAPADRRDMTRRD
jgi:Flp pilus assembly protein TadD